MILNNNKFFFIFFILLFVGFVDAASEKVTLNINQSYLIEGKNVTLINSNKDSIILCINNVRDIISETRIINGVFVDLKDSNDKNATIRLVYSCENCICDGSCGNNRCFEIKSEEKKILDGVECKLDIDCNDSNVDTLDKCVSSKCIYEINESKESEKENITSVPLEEKEKFNFNLFTIILVGIIVVLILIYLFVGSRDKS